MDETADAWISSCQGGVISWAASWLWPPPRDVLRECITNMTRRSRELTRDALDLERSAKTARTQAKAALRSGNTHHARLMAKEEVRSYRARARILVAINALADARRQISVTKAQMAMGRAMESGVVIMQQLNSLHSLPATRALCEGLSRELFRAKYIEEQIEEAISPDGEEEEEEEEGGGAKEEQELDEETTAHIERLMQEAARTPNTLPVRVAAPVVLKRVQPPATMTADQDE